MPADAGMIGRTLAGRFRVTGFIGEGAMAAVYRGAQDGEPRDVAIKVLHPHLAGDEKLVRRFRREARAASRLRHPSTVQVLGHGVEGRIAFIVMELCEGMDVFELLELEERLSEARAARIVIQVCDALAAAHELGIVHRDLKPENVMLVPVDGASAGAGAGSVDEVVKVLDFGIAKVVQQTSDLDHAPSNTGGSPLTNIGAAVGTPEYMSPEQCSGAAVDARSDLYACGVLLYQLVTGVAPFAANTVLEVMLKHLRDAPVPPSRLVPGLHAGLEATILRALAKKPDDRQPTARDLARELGVILPALEARDSAHAAKHEARGAGAASRPAKTLVYGAAVEAGVVAPQNETQPAPAPSAPAAPRPVPRTAPRTPPPPPEPASAAAAPSRPQAPSRPPPRLHAPSRPPPSPAPPGRSRPPALPAASLPSRPPAAPAPPPPSPPPAAPAAAPPSRPSAPPAAASAPSPPIAAPSDNVFVDALPYAAHSRGSAPPAPPAPAPAVATAPAGPPLRAIFAGTFVIVLLAALALLALATGRR